MKFASLKIEDWKQFDSINLDFHPQLTIFTGANGSGKTTLLHLLARNFGWDYKELATPTKEKESGVIKYLIKFFKRKEQNDDDTIVIGGIKYTDGQESSLLVSENNTAKYQIKFSNNIKLAGINVLSHRNIFKYQNVPTVSTLKKSRKDAYNQIDSFIKRESLDVDSYYKHEAINFHIKETLLSWAIGGEGNKYIEPDSELISWYEGFERVLKTIMPKNIGFEKLAIRNYELILVTKSGDFMLDAVSGGIAALIDLSWQIYNLANSEKEIVVLIDEIENHLHATMQRSVLPDLLKAFPNVQFIVSSHSPLVVSSVKDSNVFAFRYNNDYRVFSEQLDLVNKARTATEILNEVLGVPFTMPIWAEESLSKIVEKYSSLPVSEEMVNNMRNEFKTEGLENLMPLAISKILDK